MYNDFDLALVVCRAFVTLQSAEAHFELFKCIFTIAVSDTGKLMQVYYIHGDGLEAVVVDSHKGQALGTTSNTMYDMNCTNRN